MACRAAADLVGMRTRASFHVLAISLQAGSEPCGASDAFLRAVGDQRLFDQIALLRPWAIKNDCEWKIKSWLLAVGDLRGIEWALESRGRIDSHDLERVEDHRVVDLLTRALRDTSRHDTEDLLRVAEHFVSNNVTQLPIEQLTSLASLHISKAASSGLPWEERERLFGAWAENIGGPSAGWSSERLEEMAETELRRRGLGRSEHGDAAGT
jgi:hypothetical protein